MSFGRGVAGIVVLGVAVLAPGTAGVAASWTALDVVSGSGLTDTNESWEALPVDYDSDGDQDVWVGNHDQGAKLYANNGSGVYSRVALNAWPKRNVEGKIPDRHVCDWADVDKNGLVDAYCSAGRGGSNAVKYGKDNELWLQTSLGTFSEVGTAGVGDLCGRSHYVAFLHANHDTYPDLFVGNASPRPVADPCDDPGNGLPSEQSKLFINTAADAFVSSPGYGIGGYSGVRCAEVVDFNRDGWDDLFVCGNPSRLYRNRQGDGFVDVAPAQGLASKFVDAVFGDLDKDGDPDLVSAVNARITYRLNNSGTFASAVTITSNPTGGSFRSLALGDAEADGDLDVYGLVTNLGAGSNPDDSILLNTNLQFSRVGVPSSTGVGDAVTALDGDRNGKHEFLVLNGVETLGPVQLIELHLSG